MLSDREVGAKKIGLTRLGWEIVRTLDFQHYFGGNAHRRG